MSDINSPIFRSIGSWKILDSPTYKDLIMVLPGSQKVNQHDSEASPVVNGGQMKTETLDKRYSSHMEKEIFEQPNAIERTMEGRVDFEKKAVILRGIEPYREEILRCRRMILIGSGSSYHCAIATRQLIEELTELPVMVELASDFLDREVPIFRDDVCVFISQSGETHETIEALKYCKKRDALAMGITNTVNSTLSKETHCGVHANAGIEVGVASTKAYTSQYLSLVMFAIVMAEDKVSKSPRIHHVIDEMKSLPEKLRKVLLLNDKIKTLAESLHEKKSMLLLGRGYQLATCLEGAFKMKEVANLQAEGILAGELKHGPLALIEKELPVVMFVMKDDTYDKCMNAVQQVTARKGQPILICCEGDNETISHSKLNIAIPKTADCLQGILAIAPVQLLAMHITLLRKYDVDQPRNLVKAVTDDDSKHYTNYRQ